MRTLVRLTQPKEMGDHTPQSAGCKTPFMCLPGTASVIIALTDGELQEHQLITAQQEVDK